MTDHSPAQTTPGGVPATPPDAENPALIDALKTFQITLISAVLFIAAAVFIIMRTRMGS